MPTYTNKSSGDDTAIKRLRPAANGVWYYHWTEGRRSKRQSMGTKDEVEAITRLGQWLSLTDADVGIADSDGRSFKVSELWGVYLDKHVRSNVVADGQQTIGYAWKNLEPLFGSKCVPQVDQDLIDKYVRHRSVGKIGRASKPITIRRELAQLIAALNFCSRKPNKLISASIIEPLKLPDPGEPRDRWLRIDEIQRLLSAAATLRRQSAEDHAAGRPARLARGERFLWLALETAARKSAILDLTWDRVDFTTNTIHYNVPGRRRTRKKRADVPISANLRPVLERAYEERISPFVVDSQAEVWKTIQLAAIKAGFSSQTIERGAKPKATGISPHVLRHTAATHMARNGVSLWLIAKILGNTLEVVEKVYAKWVPDDPEGTVDKISAGKLDAVL